MATTSEDFELLRRCQSRDAAAFTELVDRYQRLVYAVAFQILRDRHEAADLTQEVFVQIYKKISDYRGEGKLSSWIYQIAYRRGLNYRRDLKRERQQLLTAADPESLPDPPDPTDHDPAAAISTHEQATQLLAQLPALDRLLLTLFYLQDRSITEVAQIMELSTSAVKVRLHRIREKLRAP